MKYISKKKLPVEIKNNELPKDDTKIYNFLNEEESSENSGFIDTIFLIGVMIVCFMWGMLTIILKG